MIAATDLLPRRRDLREPEHRALVVDVDEAIHRIERKLGPALGQLREPEQRIEVRGEWMLGERRQADDERSVGVLAGFEVIRELAQDLSALVGLLRGLGTLQVHIDDLVTLGVERARRDARGRALDRGAQPVAVELGELLGEGPDEDLDRAHPERHAGAGTAHVPSLTANVRAKISRARILAVLGARQ